MPGKNQKGVTISLETWDLLNTLSTVESRSLHGEIRYLVDRRIEELTLEAKRE